MRARIKSEVCDLLELVLLPGLAALLPWSWCYAVFKRIARWQWLYREPCQQALVQARARGWAGEDERHWLWSRKIVTLVDHADHYLGLFRSNRWMHRHMVVQGQWPAVDPGLLLVTFHWGAGYWGLRHAASQGVHPHALVATLTAKAYQGRWVLGWYARARNANVARTLAAQTIDAKLDLKSLIQAIRRKQPLLGVLDVPADGAKSSIPITLMGMSASVPGGLLRLAVEHQLKVVIYVTGLDTHTGQRFLHIKPMESTSNVADLAASVFAELEQAIKSDAPAWHFWSVAERFFRLAEQD